MYDDFGSVDMVIEAALEDVKLKQEIFAGGGVFFSPLLFFCQSFGFCQVELKQEVFAGGGSFPLDFVVFLCRVHMKRRNGVRFGSARPGQPPKPPPPHRHTQPRTPHITPKHASSTATELERRCTSPTSSWPATPPAPHAPRDAPLSCDVPQCCAAPAFTIAELERRCKPDAILASNTSTISLELVGARTSCPDRIVGAHFFSPAHIMPLLEIVVTDKTSKQVGGVAERGGLEHWQC